ncbi:Ku protein [Alkalibaculum sp. M08DMB]|uniref:Non-homologous end joining protein Ku n=1 Tax=Alkalibaculum sporogenes TaxID=2655001 RepID=A0A6A7KBE5_9FIRM|nr:Ku protein [Alkalibaculum sporogenes]MPW26591.1 Ku protein [Alkalibaculum sporogenes]
MHTMWKGSISFGLVNIPIKMYAATEDKDIKFRYLHKECNTPVNYKKICPACNKEIAQDDIIKGYEYEAGHFVILSDDDFKSLEKGESHKSVEILDFVDLKEIDPIYFDKSYYLSPQETGEKAYSLLRQAMKDTEKIAIAKMKLRNKESLAALRVLNDVLLVETIFYPDEVRNVKEVPNISEDIKVEEKELKIATQLIESLSAKFDAEKYKDNYREEIKELIQKKIQGKEITVTAKEKDNNIIDLMEALQASLKQSNKKTTKRTKKVENKSKTS